MASTHKQQLELTNRQVLENEIAAIKDLDLSHVLTYEQATKNEEALSARLSFFCEEWLNQHAGYGALWVIGRTSKALTKADSLLNVAVDANRGLFADEEVSYEFAGELAYADFSDELWKMFKENRYWLRKRTLERILKQIPVVGMDKTYERILTWESLSGSTMLEQLDMTLGELDARTEMMNAL